MDAEDKPLNAHPAQRPCREGYIVPRLQYRTLARCVMAVAVPGDPGIRDWTAYIDAVPGKVHADEVQAVADHGSKLCKSIATLLFPEFDPQAYRL